MHVTFSQVKADYQLGPIRTPNVVDDVSVEIKSGSFTAVIGKTGAGKSSLLKLVNGLLIPKVGQIQVGPFKIDQDVDQKQLSQLRKRVGMIFQFPENQLFAETVEADISFGPNNFGFTKEEINRAVKESLQHVGLSEAILKRSPFSLSGGQQRRVALAGVLATNPDVLVLDEPGAGLDPNGKREIMSMIKALNEKQGRTVILVTHDMNDVCEYADDVLLMDQGKIMIHQETRSFFSQKEKLSKWGVDLPDVVRLQECIERQKDIQLEEVALTKTELIDLLIKEKIL